MPVFGPGIFSSDVACDLRADYSLLLSAGYDAEGAEKYLIEYYSYILLCKDGEDVCFWLALAWCEWKKGRLSEYVKNKALDLIDSGEGMLKDNIFIENSLSQRQKNLTALKQMLLSPMPPAKPVPKPRITKCPWKKGSLLAYRISTNTIISERASYNKYALLRVVDVVKKPISRILPELYNESMYVGLYGWIGDDIPNPDIVKNLEYIAISRDKPLLDDVQAEYFKELWPKNNPMLKDINPIEKLTKSYDTKIVDLDWKPMKKAKEVITLIDCDENFEIPAFFLERSPFWVLTHYLPFDVTLCNALDKYVK